ncbi:MAG: bifunctional tetrahydrofolate synthase/dihydrofolate synthase [Dyella sp.]
MSDKSLAQWLSYQEQVNLHSIELGLDRVRAVWQRMGAARPAPVVITVGGTNGKGSSVALLEAMLRAAGLRVGCYTSPHLLRYNERVRIEGSDADDAALIGAFERIDAARRPGHVDEIKLTYFEFGTLAAMDLFAGAGLDVAVLEVGLGGRLDAVNIIDADAVLITTVDLDHTEWLGPDRDRIGVEKAGIARPGRPAIIGECSPPQGLCDALAAIGARTIAAGADFNAELTTQGWRWHHRDGDTLDLPPLTLAAPVQYANAAAAIACLHALHVPLQRLAGGHIQGDNFVQCWSAAIAQALREVTVPARLQSLGGDPALIVDVGHNPQAARALAEWLRGQPGGPVHAVYGALADKDVSGVIEALADHIDHWHLAGLERDTTRGLSATEVAAILLTQRPQARHHVYPDVATALAAARQTAPARARVLAFGSFFVASAVLAIQSQEASQRSV